MFSKLNVFQLAHAMATHAGKRQAVVSTNVANADTPGYKARDLKSFEQLVDAGKSAKADVMIASRAGHLNGQFGTGETSLQRVAATEATTSDQGVSIEIEMMKASEAKRQHDRALAIYKSSLNILRASLGRS